MKELTSEEILSLNFGSQIKIVFHNSKYHYKDETFRAVVYGNKIGYEDGLIDHIRIIAEQVSNDECKVYLI